MARPRLQRLAFALGVLVLCFMPGRAEAQFNLGGQVTSAAPSCQANVTMTLTGTGAPAPTTTASNGTYSFLNVPAGTYTLTPSAAGCVFVNASEPVVGTTLPIVKNFTGFALITISGTITASGGGALEGVVVELTGAASATTSTDGSGAYSFTNLTPFTGGSAVSYTVTPSLSNYTFSPPSRIFNNPTTNQTQNFTGTPQTLGISGTVTKNGTGLIGVTMTLTGTGVAPNTTTTTNASGAYTFSGLTSGGDYTVTPSLANHTFTPPSETRDDLTVSATGVDFTAQQGTVTISGTVTRNAAPLSGVTMSLTGGATQSVQTDGSGNYSFTGLAGGQTYTVTPSLAGNNFSPPDQTFPGVNADQTGVDFTATQSFTISGTVTKGGGLGGVTMTLSGSRIDTTTTAANGTYSFTGLSEGGNYTVTPSLSGNSFNPTSRTYNALNANQVADFAASDATTRTIAGTVKKNGVGLAGVTMTLTGTPGTTTNASGEYSFSGLTNNGNYTITPSLSRHVFQPVSQTFNPLATDQTVDFSATEVSTVSGTVTKDGAPLVGVTITLSGDQAGSTTTNGSGQYSFVNLPNGGAYTVTPSLAGNTFAPPSQSFTNLSTDQTADFTATGAAGTLTISGTVTKDGAPLGGVTLTLSGTLSRSTSTNATGQYSFTGLTNGGSYTVTPALANHTFTPGSQTFSNMVSSSTADFSASVAAGTRTISGTVTKDGAPLAGATMTLSGSASASTSTNALGQYSFTGLTSGGSYTVTPTLANHTFTPGSQTFNNMASDSTADFSASVAVGTRTISGTVTKDGAPLSGVTITLSGSLSRTTTTAADGTYALGGLTSGGSYTVTPSLSNHTFTPPVQTLANLTTDATADFSASVAAGTLTISGTITKDGDPLGGVTVALTGTLSRTVTTASNGQYALTGLTSGGTYTVTPSLANHTFTPGSQTLSNMVSDSTADFAASVAAGTRTISGEVTKDGAPLSGVTLTLGGATNRTTQTGADGQYAFSGLTNGGTYTVTPSLANHTFTPTSQTLNNLTTDATADFSASVAAGTRTISGLVTKNGAGLGGVTITLTGTLSRTTTTSADGTYSLGGLTNGGTYTVTPSLANHDFTPAVQNFSNLAIDATADFEASVAAGTRSIAGTITRDGAPLGGVTVNVTGTAGASTTTDANGQYGIGGLPNGGDYTVTPTLTNHTFSPPSQAFVAMSTDQTADFSASVAAGTRTISGTVTQDGSPLGGVTLVLSGSLSASTTTGADGKYAFGGLTSGGNYTVTPSLDNFTFTPASQSFDNLTTDQTADFAASAAGGTRTISGRITRDGTPLSGVTVRLSGTTSRSTTTDGNGQYTFAGLTSGGDYTVTPSLSGNTFLPPSLRLNPLTTDPTVDFAATSVPGGTQEISGTITKDGVPQPGVTVTVTGPGGTSATTTTDANGRYSVSGLPSGGTYTVTPTLAGHEFSPSSRTFTDLTSGQTSNFTATEVPGGPKTISGTITKDGVPQPGVAVTVTDSGGASTTAVTDTNGRYTVSGLPTGGTYTVTPTRAGHDFSPRSRTFTNLTGSETSNFTSFEVTSVSGTVRDLNGTGVEGATVTLTGDNGVTQTTTTDEDGNFTFDKVPLGGDYTVTPTKDGFTFSPSSSSVSDLQSPTTLADTTATSGLFRRYFAEGATSPQFFDTTFALLNATGTPATATVKFQKPDGSEIPVTVNLAGIDRKTVVAKDADPRMINAEFSTVVESTQPVIADRTMTWDPTKYGSHAETSIAKPLTSWYLAEGATIAGFDLFYLVQNPNDTTAQIEVKYLLPSPQAPITKNYQVTPRSRFNIWVNTEDSRLDDAELSAVITSTNDVPVIVERAMYRPVGIGPFTQVFGAGHESAGVEEPGLQWFFAEGATGPFFDLFILVANPNTQASKIEAQFLKPGGVVVTRTYDVGPNSRFNIWVDTEGADLADTAVSTSIRVTNGVPVIAERAMWWQGTSATWYEGHNSAGATRAGTKWGLAEGQFGGPDGLETYILVANTSTFGGRARVTLIFDDGTPSESREYDLPALSRTNVAVGSPDFPVASGKRFGAIVESLGGTPAQIVVERAMYNNAGGVQWAAGTNAIGTRLR